jgi:putative membrane-bound dehydrogenase-like protein
MKQSAPCIALALVAAASLHADELTIVGPNIRPLAPKPGPQPFTYTEASDKLPNYLAGEKWGTQGQAITQMQAPLSAEESSKRLVVQPGFIASLFAAEPDITKPIALAWDERGRLWVAETVDYPNEQQPEGQGRDRIKICEDTNGDGRADKFTVFADKLSIPTSLCFGNGGLIVIEGGHTLFLKDTNGDDKADERKVLFSGWNMGDTHATASNLRYGLDNWIWGTVGYSGFDGEVGGKKHKFGMGVFRFKPDGSAIEFIRSSNNNTWGLGLTEDGLVLGSTANGNAAWYMPIPNRYYETVSGWNASRMETVADTQAIYPVTEKVRQVDWHNKYTAGAGSAIYTARAFPQEFWNQISFVCEPTGHLIGWFRYERQGADFKAVNLGSFLASDDEWTAPIVAEVGPDGAVWVLDWYNYIVQHNPVPIGFKNGKGNAYETPIRDKRHGRVYRVVASGMTATAAPAALQQAKPAELVTALKSDNQLWRLHAQRLLVERGDQAVVPALRELVADPSADALGLNPTATHALWTLHGINSIGAETIAALKHPSASVRRAAVGVLPRNDASRDTLVRAGMLKDSEAQVRLAALLALADMPTDEAAGTALVAALLDPRNAGDRWLRDAIAAAAAKHLEGFGKAIIGSVDPLPEGALEVVRIVARHYATPAPDSVAQVVSTVAATAAPATLAVLDGLIAGWPAQSKPDFAGETEAQLSEAMSAFPEAAKDKLLVLAQKWNRLDLFTAQVVATQQRLAAKLADTAAGDPERIEAARGLLRLADELANVRATLTQISLQASPALAGGLLNALGESRLSETGAEILGRWKTLTPSQKRGALNTLLRRGPWATAVLDQLDAGNLVPKDLDGGQWQTLRNNPDRDLAARARTLAEKKGKLSADREAVMKQFLPAAKKAGDVKRGQELYAQNCGVCHLFYGAGGKVGPDLSGIGVRAKDEILAEILDPNRSVEANYVLWTVETKAGETFSGRLDTETQTSIELYDLQGQKHALQRKDIASLEASNQSIMPTGLEQVGEQGLADILEYLAAGVQK